jgi:MFS family permease
VNTLIAQQPKYANANLSHFSSLFSSLVFAGTLLGMLSFGVLSDRIGRKVRGFYMTADKTTYSHMHSV